MPQLPAIRRVRSSHHSPSEHDVHPSSKVTELLRRRLAAAMVDATQSRVFTIISASGKAVDVCEVPFAFGGCSQNIAALRSATLAEPITPETSVDLERSS